MLEEAYCYEIDEMVVARTALAWRNSEDYGVLRFFCPVEECVQEVRPVLSTRNTPFFRASKNHRSWCPHDQRSKGETGEGKPAPHDPVEPSPVVPTVLGPMPEPNRINHGVEPSEQELRVLVSAAKAKPPFTPGSFEEVVDAWRTMTVEERKEQALLIGGRQYTYHTAFQIIAAAGDDMSMLDWGQRIIYGKIKSFSILDRAGQICMLKKFKVEDEVCQFKVTGPLAWMARLHSAHDGDNIGDNGTAFLLGDVPRYNAQKRTYYFRTDEDKYTGLVVRNEYL